MNLENDSRRRDPSMLRARGYAVLVADSPAAALALSAEHRGEIALLVSDIVMPEMSGYELAEQLRSHQPQLRHLFISGYARGLRTVGGELESGVLLLQKPFTSAELARSVREVLDSAPPVSAWDA
jgi:two-component system, cell cycle sensor histidine kinase and response regulator CckA